MVLCIRRWQPSLAHFFHCHTLASGRLLHAHNLAMKELQAFRWLGSMCTRDVPLDIQNGAALNDHPLQVDGHMGGSSSCCYGWGQKAYLPVPPLPPPSFLFLVSWPVFQWFKGLPHFLPTSPCWPELPQSRSPVEFYSLLVLRVSNLPLRAAQTSPAGETLILRLKESDDSQIGKTDVLVNCKAL